ncbi:hypothetical protein AVEN_4217-1 [Araneus ventricosus]|uniref:Uncharacterized protein n=1 Tax=Araneus ventricosus TaxID=182803 RepID=A0A4Y2VY03_ARAVE|nr:hypothetical protein AVEN_4217-1 [Araneus ventricosus]
MPLQEQKFITDQRSERAMTTGTVDLQTTKQLQKTAAWKAKTQALEKAQVRKFQLEGLKPSEILGEENVKVYNSNDIAVDKNAPLCSTPQTRLFGAV